jgi:hypothetical protein
MARHHPLLHVAVATAIALLFFAAGPGAARSARACSGSPYAYAGIQTTSGTHGIAATIASVRSPAVSSGHVAGWVGVGGPGAGAGGQNAWIQIGLNTMAGQDSVIYAEAWVPGQGQLYKELGNAPVGQHVRLAVLEVRGRPGVWRAWADGRPVTRPVYLPGSEAGAWVANAVGESWTAGAAVCNGYAYSFEDVAEARAPGGSWRRISGTRVVTIHDPGYELVRNGGTFLARSAF